MFFLFNGLVVWAGCGETRLRCVRLLYLIMCLDGTFEMRVAVTEWIDRQLT